MLNLPVYSLERGSELVIKCVIALSASDPSLTDDIIERISAFWAARNLSRGVERMDGIAEKVSEKSRDVKTES